MRKLRLLLGNWHAVTEPNFECENFHGCVSNIHVLHRSTFRDTVYDTSLLRSGHELNSKASHTSTMMNALHSGKQPRIKPMS